MAILAESWYDRIEHIVPRQNITEVAVVRSYTPNRNELASWDASFALDGSAMAYIAGTKLTIVCDLLTEIPEKMFFKFVALEKIYGLNAVTTIGELAFCYFLSVHTHFVCRGQKILLICQEYHWILSAIWQHGISGGA